MTRVTNNSAAYAVNYSLGKTKGKLEDIQIKGSNLKTIQKPSDNPEGTTEVLTIRSRKSDATQYARNIMLAKTQLEYTESALSDLTDVLIRAKELAVAQSSQTYNSDARKSVAEEVNQLYSQALSIGNKRLGNKYIFSGTKTFSRPFDELGRYSGDDNRIHLEVGMDRYIPINITGAELSSGTQAHEDNYKKPNFNENDKLNNAQPENPGSPNGETKRERILASNDLESLKDKKLQPKDQDEESVDISDIKIIDNPKSSELFSDLKSFYNALMTDNPTIIQSLLDKFDSHIEATVKLRTKLGSLVNSLNNTEIHNERDLVMQEEYMSKIEDADVMELYTELQKQQGILDASYRTSASLLNKSLLNFLN